MIRKKLLASATLAALAFPMGFLSPLLQKTSYGKETVKVVWRQKMSHHSYTIDPKKAKNAYAYSAKLGKKVFKLANYRKRTFQTSFHQKLRINQHSRIYYYVTSTSGKKVSGWVWRGYLNKSKTTTNSAKADPIIGASVRSESDLKSYIDAAPDLDPNLTVLGFESSVYTKYRAFLSAQYNLGQFSSAGVFKDHQARVYVADDQLQPYVSAAIDNWNTALGKTVFTLGTKDDHTLTVQLDSATGKQWDGLFNQNVIDINASTFTNPDYATNNIASSSTLDNKLNDISQQASDLLDSTNVLLTKLRFNYQLQYLALQSNYNQASGSDKTAISKQMSSLTTNYENQEKIIRANYQSQIADLQQLVKNTYNQEQVSLSHTSMKNYWTTVIMHEMGHSMGLYHTPYKSDVMYASASNEQSPDATPSPVRYSWTQPKDPDDARAYTTATLSSRDVDRAKLAEILGYW
ncbi:matrixin family metalloprotease [Lentilactobacillus parafarraginis]|jgi:hypothetical protein|uniref:Peptidase M10 metallopeptidase domain-containing protein n=1 Tax=Lentilactobacillus parafarraginis DSM 18390 = JCM 14109 TaxID=1423786 RepID=A0A0R1YRB9_9LACO|nr:matrixin family metalloprotease [Lentilactobacillus parafarraginis]KRM43412.1 hypothetical protein FD47_GL001570 [Lentilactobacillus parafarraginis DSM 18390 = JCM 14109]